MWCLVKTISRAKALSFPQNKRHNMPGGKAVRKIGSREITRYRLRIKIYIKLLDISQRSLLRGHYIVTCNDTCSHYIYNLCDTFRDKRCRYFRHLLEISVVGHFYLLERLTQFLLILICKKIIAGGLLKKMLSI